MSVTIIVCHNHGNRIDRAMERSQEIALHIYGQLIFNHFLRYFNTEMKHFQQILLEQLDIPVELGVGRRENLDPYFTLYAKNS